MTTGGDTYTVGGPQVAWRETGGEVVILDLNDSVYFGLNGTGATLWKRLTTGATRTELAALLIEQAHARPPQAATDVDTFLGALDQHGLLRSN